MKSNMFKLKKWFIRFVCLMLLWSFIQLIATPDNGQWLPKYLKQLDKTSKKENFVQVFPFTRNNLNRTLKILLWTNWYGYSDWQLRNDPSYFSTCAVSNCAVTKDKSEIVTSDAVLFHASDFWTGITGYPLPQYRKQDQVWIWYTMEAPPSTATNPELHNGVFNWTSSYRRDSDIYFPYFGTRKLQDHNRPVENIAATKSLGIAWVSSNCADDARRQMLVREIRKYIQVDTYGNCGEKSLPSENMITLLKQYKFYLAFENSYCRDYVTEKFYLALQRRNIPIVGGGLHYKDLAPPHSYIDVTDFDSVKDFVDYLRYLDKNATAYNEYFRWTEHMETWIHDLWCELCEALHDVRRPHQVYTDLVGYISDDTCPLWEFPRAVFRVLQGHAMKYGLI